MHFFPIVDAASHYFLSHFPFALLYMLQAIIFCSIFLSSGSRYWIRGYLEDQGGEEAPQTMNPQTSMNLTYLK